MKRYLDMLEPIKVFENLNPNKDFVSEILSFDVRRLETLQSLEISKYAIALAQYLVYFQYQYNKVQSELIKARQFIEETVAQLLTPDIIKRYKTKKDATHFIVNSTTTLYEKQQEHDNLKAEVMLLENMAASLTELIAAFKRELTRREKELWQARDERR